MLDKNATELFVSIHDALKKIVVVQNQNIERIIALETRLNALLERLDKPKVYVLPE